MQQFKKLKKYNLLPLLLFTTKPTGHTKQQNLTRNNSWIFQNEILVSLAKLSDFSESLKLNHMMEKLESVQYSAALAVTGAWKGTSREKLYNELRWESLNLRRWSRRLVLFFKIVNNLTPEYTRQPIPPLPQSNYRLRRPAIIGQMRARTMSFGASFYPNCLSEWNKLESEIRQLPTLGMLKKKLFSLIRPLPQSVYSIHDPKGLAILQKMIKFQHIFGWGYFGETD